MNQAVYRKLGITPQQIRAKLEKTCRKWLLMCRIYKQILLKLANVKEMNPLVQETFEHPIGQDLSVFRR